MAFIVEDGTGVADANAYIETSFADDYFSDRGIDDWSGDDSEKQAAIINATDYFDRRFGDRLSGYRLTEDQGREFPREHLYVRGKEVEGIPTDLKYAIAEYALRSMQAALAPDPEYDESGFQVKSKTEVVGPIEESVTYGQPIPLGNRKYPIVDALVRKYLKGHGGGVYR